VLTLRGSWASGEFHLSRGEGFSLSDVDLIAVRPEGPRLLPTVQASMERLGLPKVSCHPPGSFGGLSLLDGFWLDVTQFAVEIGAEPVLPVSQEVSQAYATAKLALRLARVSAHECLADVARRLSSREANAAMAVKLGLRQEFSARRGLSLIRRHAAGNRYLRAVAEECLGTSGPDLVKLRQALCACATVPLWLLQYQLAKLDCLKGGHASAVA
jgi:hypothetical protein